MMVEGEGSDSLDGRQDGRVLLDDLKAVKKPVLVDPLSHPPEDVGNRQRAKLFIDTGESFARLAEVDDFEDKLIGEFDEVVG